MFTLEWESYSARKGSCNLSLCSWGLAIRLRIQRNDMENCQYRDTSLRLGECFLCILVCDIRVGTELCSSMYRIASFALHREAQQRFRNIKDAHSSHGIQKPHKSLPPGRSLSLDAYGILNPANKRVWNGWHWQPGFVPAYKMIENGSCRLS
jgi:hypothetical protein